MGEIADSMLLHSWRRPRPAPKCNRCGDTSVYWQNGVGRRKPYLAIYSSGGLPHRCQPNLNGMPIHA